MAKAVTRPASIDGAFCDGLRRGRRARRRCVGDLRQCAGCPLLQALIEQNQQRRFRPGLRLRLAHHPDAEVVAADAVARDRADHRTSDRAIRGDRARGGWPRGAAERSAAARPPPSERRAAAPTADRRRRSRAPCRRDRHFRFLCRGGGAPLPGAPRHRPSTAWCASRPSRRSTCRRAARLAQLKTNLARLRAMSSNLGDRASSSATFRRRRSRRSRTASRCRATPRSSASRTGLAGDPTAASSRSISIRTGPCRSRSSGKDLIPKMQAEPDYLTKNRIRIFDQRGSELHARADQLVFGRGGELSVSSRIRATSIRSARSASISPIRTASTCTTRR